MQHIDFRNHTRLAAAVLAAGSLLVAQTPSQSVPDPAAPGGSASSSSAAGNSQASGNQAGAKGMDTKGAQLTEAEKTFVHEALESGRKEVEVAKMAQKQASGPVVKNLAKKLVSDHTAANKKLESIAKKNMAGMTSTKASTMSGDSGLPAEHGAAFDHAFAAKAVEDHEKGIAKYEAAEKEATNPELKSYISSTLPKLREHLEMAKAAIVSSGINAAGAGSSATTKAEPSSTSGSTLNHGNAPTTNGSSTNPGNIGSRPNGATTPGSTTPGGSTPGGSSTTPPVTPQR